MKKFTSCLMMCCMSANIAGADFVKHEKMQQKNDQYAVGYNVSPQILGDKKYDISFDASFLYYYAGQDGLDLANSGAVLTSGGSTGTVVATDNSVGLVQDFTYNPGFKVGAAVSCDEWILSAEYTRLNQSTLTNQAAVVPSPATGSGVWVLNNWFEQVSSFGQTMSATNVASQWNLAMNFADLTMGHSFYEGRYLSIVPFFGVRGAWINQALDVTITVPSVTVTDLVTDPISSFNSSNSWAVGPRTGFDVSWLFESGLRLEGAAAASLLFTQFTDVNHSEQVASAADTQLSMQLLSVNCVRPELDFSVGLGWGTHVKDEKYYVDFSINYDFLLLCQQNMMRKLADQMVSATSAAAGDLYLQGVSVRAAFYF